jgi:hypothetical protein
VGSKRFVRPLRTALIALLFHALTLPFLSAQLSTPDHLAEPGFWPTRNGTTRDEYVGSQVCASCHASKVAVQRNTSMAKTAAHASDAEILQAISKMNFSVGKFSYEIRREESGSVYTVTDGAKTFSFPLLWAFGTGRVGQSYLYKKEDGKFYEARVTYFDTLKNLHFTPGRALDAPKDLQEAMERQVPADEIERCFACHTTAATMGKQLDEQKLMLGVTCEACHGPGAKHVAAAQMASMAGTPDAARGTIFNAAHLDPADTVDFCGACHATFWDVKLTGAKSVSTAKSQPYRLEQSKCWGNGDARLTCPACHDPHVQLETESAPYDRFCVNCHAAGLKKTDEHVGAVCKVGTKECSSCHMPKVNVPEMHYAFTDHRIRVVRAGDSYPE